MKAVIIFLCCSFLTVTAWAQTATADFSIPDSTKKIEVLQVACGSCKFGLAGKDCALAVWVKGKARYADGAHIDSLGDAHAHDGMCNVVRKAEVQGELVDNRFKISYIRLLPMKSKNK
jgi:hypothetical protein